MKKIIINALLLSALVVAGVAAGSGARAFVAWSQGDDAQVTRGDFTQVVDGQSAEVVLFATATCPYCKMAREFLGTHGIKYTELDINEPKNQALFASLGGEGVPVLYTKQARIIGFIEREYRQQLIPAAGH